MPKSYLYESISGGGCGGSYLSESERNMVKEVRTRIQQRHEVV